MARPRRTSTPRRSSARSRSTPRSPSATTATTASISWTCPGAAGKFDETDIPDDLADTAREYREKLVEAVAETDDDLLARYLEEGTLDEGAVIKALRAAIGAGKLVPVLCGAATKMLGVRSLLELVVDSFPSPADRAAVEGVDPRTKETVSRAPSAKDPLAALVFKPLTDPHV